MYLIRPPGISSKPYRRIDTKEGTKHSMRSDAGRNLAWTLAKVNMAGDIQQESKRFACTGMYCEQGRLTSQKEGARFVLII